MMDTVLDLGMNDAVGEGMVELTGDEHFVYDSYRRLVQMFGSVVLGIGSADKRKPNRNGDVAPHRPRGDGRAVFDRRAGRSVITDVETLAAAAASLGRPAPPSVSADWSSAR